MLIGTTYNITDYAVKTHIFTTLSNSDETTIQNLQQGIPAPSAQQFMNAILEYAITKDIGDASTAVAQYSHGGNGGQRRQCGGQCGGHGGGRGNGCQNHNCTYCKMDNRTTEACVEREDAESDTSSARYEERTSYRFGLTGHFEANCVQFNRARVHRNKVNKETASASLGKAEDRDLI
jgi:hypothetical protein